MGFDHQALFDEIEQEEVESIYLHDFIFKGLQNGKTNLRSDNLAETVPDILCATRGTLPEKQLNSLQTPFSVLLEERTFGRSST